MNISYRKKVCVFSMLFFSIFLLICPTASLAGWIGDLLGRDKKEPVQGEVKRKHSPPPSVLKVGETTYPLTLEPFNLKMQVEHRLSGLVYEPLLDKDEKGRFREVLLQENSCEEIGVNAWRIHLMNGLRWSDGDTVSINDLEYTLQTMGCTRHPYADYFRDAKLSVQGEDILFTFPRNVKHTGLNKKFFRIPLVKNNAFGRCPDRPFIQTEDRDALKGTGPFVFQEYNQTTDVLRFSSNKYYREGNPFFREVEIDILTNVDRIIDGLRQRERDGQYLDLCTTVPYTFFRRLDEKMYSHLRAFVNYSRSIYCIGFNFGATSSDRHRIFRQQDFRKAMMHGFDRRAVIDSHFRQDAMIRNGPIGADDSVQGAEVEELYPPDKTKAENLLRTAARGAGMTYSPGEGLLDENGKAVTFRISYPAWEPGARKVISVFCDQMRELGLSIGQRKINFRKEWEDVKEEGDFDLVYIQLYLGESLDFAPYFKLGGRKNYFHYNTGGSQTYMRRYHTAKNEIERRNYLAKAHNSLREEVPALFLWRPIFRGVIRNDIKTGEATKLDPFNLFRNITRWRTISH